MERLVLKKGLFNTGETLEQYKYSEKIFIKRYLKQFLIMVLTNLTSIILLTVDGWVVSLFVGKDALNSVNLLTPLTMITGALTLLLSTGVNIVLSKTYGVGSEEKKDKLFRAIVLLTGIFTVGIAALQIPVAYLIINSYPISDEIKNMMSLYAVGLIISGTISVVSTLCTYILIASGQVKKLLKLAILESTLNLILDFLFVACFKMGVFGAGLGTAISCAARCVVSVILVQKSVKIFPTKQIECTDEMKNILSNGVPSMVTQLMISVMGYLMNIIMTVSGNMEAVTVISVCTIGGTVISMLSLSFVQAGNSIIGILIGSEDWEIAKKLNEKILLITVTVVSVLVMIVVIFPQILFRFYNINDYTNFQSISARLYMLAYIPFTVASNLTNMCVYCEKKKVTVITKILEAILLIVMFITLDKINHNLVFLCYALRFIVSGVILSIVLIKALNKKLSETNALNEMHFSFKGSEAIEASEKLFKYLKNNGVSGNDTYRLALVCEELGAYAEKGGNGDELYIFLAVKIFDKHIHVFYLDDGGPSVLNKKLNATNLIMGNYNLIESMASEFTYQNVSGFNNFIMKFDR